MPGSDDPAGPRVSPDPVGEDIAAPGPKQPEPDPQLAEPRDPGLDRGEYAPEADDPAPAAESPERVEIQIGPGCETPSADDAYEPDRGQGGYTPGSDPLVPPVSPPPRQPEPAGAAGFKALMWRLVTDFQFNGRMAREPYWKMFAVRAAVVLVFFLITAGTSSEGEMSGEPDIFGLLAGLLAVVVSISGIAEASRRLHDTGKTGWWNLLLVIPYLGWAGWIFLLAQPGAAGDNPYGPAPAGDTPFGTPGA